MDNSFLRGICVLNLNKAEIHKKGPAKVQYDTVHQNNITMTFFYYFGSYVYFQSNTLD